MKRFAFIIVDPQTEVSRLYNVIELYFYIVISTTQYKEEL